jgi:hypothetical protein
MAAYTLEIPKDSDTHRKLVKMLASRIQLARKHHNGKREKWIEAEESMLAYIPETQADQKRRMKREDGTPQYTTIRLPYVYAQVMAVHTYMTSVLFARSPIHQLVGRNGTGEMQVQAMEALLQYQVEAGGMNAPYYLWCYDAPKYGVGVLGHWWDKQVVQYTSIQNDRLVTNQVQGYEGNCAYNVSPFDFLTDPRVTIREFQKGEFCIHKRAIPWADVSRRRALGYYIERNLRTIKGSGAERVDRNDGSSQLPRPDTTLKVEDQDGEHPAVLHCYEVYVELAQKEWGLGMSLYPEKWVFTITQDLETIIGVTPLGLMHGMFPFDVGEPELDAYAEITRSVPDIMKGVGDTLDWLVNSHMWNVRQTMNNQFVGDPSKLFMKDFMNANQPGFFLRLRPEAYGTDVRTVLSQIPVMDVTRQHLNDVQFMMGFGERILGVNDQIMGVLAGGGRKTATEVRTSTGFGVNRLKTITEYFSAVGFAPHAQKLIQSTQQNFKGPLALRIVGDAAALNPDPWLRGIDPSSIVGQYDLSPVDGTLPIDRMAQANLWKEFLMMISRVPQIAEMWDLGKIFGYAAQISGMKNVNQFKVQIEDPELLAREAQAGNVVPFNPSAAAGNPAMTGLTANGMVPEAGMGA